MYVAGQLADVDKVLVDIGTGYYVEMVKHVMNTLISFKQCYCKVMHNCLHTFHTKDLYFQHKKIKILTENGEV